MFLPKMINAQQAKSCDFDGGELILKKGNSVSLWGFWESTNRRIAICIDYDKPTSLSNDMQAWLLYARGGNDVQGQFFKLLENPVMAPEINGLVQAMHREMCQAVSLGKMSSYQTTANNATSHRMREQEMQRKLVRQPQKPSLQPNSVIDRIDNRSINYVAKRSFGVW
jgi:hypothetical protein